MASKVTGIKCSAEPLKSGVAGNFGIVRKRIFVYREKRSEDISAKRVCKCFI